MSKSVARVAPGIPAASASVTPMTRRRARGAAVGATALYVRIAPDVADYAEATAVRLGVSKAELIQRLLEHERDAAQGGPPTWWPPTNQEALETTA